MIEFFKYRWIWLPILVIISVTSICINFYRLKVTNKVHWDEIVKIPIHTRIWAEIGLSLIVVLDIAISIFGQIEWTHALLVTLTPYSCFLIQVCYLMTTTLTVICDMGTMAFILITSFHWDLSECRMIAISLLLSPLVVACPILVALSVLDIHGPIESTFHCLSVLRGNSRFGLLLVLHVAFCVFLIVGAIVLKIVNKNKRKYAVSDMGLRNKHNMKTLEFFIECSIVTFVEIFIVIVARWANGHFRGQEDFLSSLNDAAILFYLNISPLARLANALVGFYLVRKQHKKDTVASVRPFKPPQDNDPFKTLRTVWRTREENGQEDKAKVRRPVQREPSESIELD